MTIVLYTWPKHGGLPSLTAAALQAEAALRLGKVEFCVQHCASSSTPTGVIPALDTGSEVPASSEAGDLAAARAILAALTRARVLDLDGWLSPGQRAELLAFASLVAARLDPATHYTTWLEPRGFREFRKAAWGSSLPFPLSYIVPWSMRHDMARQLGAIDGAKAYAGAVEVLGALADRLRASPGPYFFGDRPSSLDALLFGHLAFYRYSPVAAPVLRSQVDQQAVLARFVDRVLGEAFAAEAPPPPADDGSSWSDAAQGVPSPPKHVPTVEEVRLWRGSQYWLGGAAAAVGAYVLLGGHYFTIETLEDGGGGGDGDDDGLGDEHDDDE